MEKVYDLHIHYTFDIPLKETIEIFKEEFEYTNTEKYCFLSIPYKLHGKSVSLEDMQNIKALYLKKAFSPNAYAFAGLEYDSDNLQVLADSFLGQAKEYFSVGYDGIKMLEGYPSLLKARNIPLDHEVYDKFYAFMEQNGYPIIMHMANPKENWDKEAASADAIAQGRVYDSTYPTKEDITSQVFSVMEKFPKLKLILAHFGFFSYDIAEAEKFLSYKNTAFDITPGGEQLINMGKEWKKWLPFWEKYQDRIFYGTDFYAFPKDDKWEISFNRRPKFIRQLLETDQTHVYLNEEFKGVLLDKQIRDKIYRDNFVKLLGEPKKIDDEYILNEVKRISLKQEHKSLHAKEDLQYISTSLKDKI
jgi:hypothetical protein